jgi:hypothetical protein
MAPRREELEQQARQSSNGEVKRVESPTMNAARNGSANNPQYVLVQGVVEGAEDRQCYPAGMQETEGASGMGCRLQERAVIAQRPNTSSDTGLTTAATGTRSASIAATTQCAAARRCGRRAERCTWSGTGTTKISCSTEDHTRDEPTIPRRN